MPADDGVTVEEIAERLGLTRDQFNAAVAEIRALAARFGSWAGAETVATAASLLRERCEERYENGLRVASLLCEGITSNREIADELGLTTAQVREEREDLEPIARRLRTLSPG